MAEVAQSLVVHSVQDDIVHRVQRSDHRKVMDDLQVAIEVDLHHDIDREVQKVVQENRTKKVAIRLLFLYVSEPLIGSLHSEEFRDE